MLYLYRGIVYVFVLYYEWINTLFEATVVEPSTTARLSTRQPMTHITSTLFFTWQDGVNLLLTFDEKPADDTITSW